MFGNLKAFRRIAELEERLEKLERAQKQVNLEWEDVYEKLTRTVQRITKRAQVVEAAEAEVPPDMVDESGGKSTNSLDERQRKIQNALLSQRSRRGNGLLPR